MPRRRIAALTVLGLAFATAPALAQPLGTFRWQLQPFCNIVTVNVTQQGLIYSLDGTDDRCGGGNQPGSAVGIAYLTPLGLVGFGITTVLPDGTPVHTEATISIASLSGTWRDSAGNNGSFIFTPGAGIGGAPRPIPSGGLAAATVTAVQLAPNAVSGANVTDASLTIADLADPPASAFADGDQELALAAAAAVVRSVTITAAAAGRVTVIVSGYVSFNSAAAADGGRCTVTDGLAIDMDHLILAAEAPGVDIRFMPIAATRGFDVAAGSHTFNLVCDEVVGDVRVHDSHMTATFIPTP